ncbi:polysaccharide lyase family 8 super-sandwich domain-containing protein [Lederbergia lenta]|uniref:polysaccharide lyase family 8 super-sandwich domain-containing protein n=1 Tax=Lederbergia lenta TaxID=1467 RepID=UPI00203EF336|nr:polysaccharide lyase family 8 super-sandwich domain-containing protein [Lederbergia lenta]MCM3110864.1 DNRLRE domain-containing protein [Lederbergia lenta]
MKKVFSAMLTVILLLSVFFPGIKSEAEGNETTETEAYEKMRLKWFNRLTGNDQYNADDTDMVTYIEGIVSLVSNDKENGHWDTMEQSKDRTYLWSDLTSTTNSDDVSTNYYRLRDMAYAYAMEGSTHYQNTKLRDAIIDGMQWMYVKHYNENKAQYGNWWNWEIGAPTALKDLLVLMYDDLQEKEITNYLNAIHRFVPDSVNRDRFPGVIETGANRTDKALIVTISGIIGENSNKIAEARDALSQVFLYTTKGDGFYRDGSFIQHNHVPYNGSYGSVLVNGLANVLYLLNDSPWSVTDPNAANVYNWIKDSFEPLMYKGAMMDMVRGRAISRENSSDHTTGRSITLSILRLAEGVPANQALELKSMAKEWIQSDKTFDEYYRGINIYDMILAKSVVNDDSIETRGELVKNQIFGAMDRVVHQRPEFALGISMSSSRISGIEMGTHSGYENTKGWYTGYGMTYLYNDDLKQFSNDYWPTIDMLRLPGTTTDGTEGKPVQSWSPYLSTKSWVGGSSIDGLYGAAGMEFDIENSTLTGKKSWFMFDDEIVALGSGITGSENRKTETIIENRQLNRKGDNALTVNKESKPNKSGWKEQMKSVKWAHLEGNTDHSAIGYFFPKPSTVLGLRESRTGAWEDINFQGSTDQITRNYLSLAVDHGGNPERANYEYVLLPSKNIEETDKYAQDPDIVIIENSESAHAVKENKLGIIAANFFESKPYHVDFIRSYGPASVMVKEEGDELTISVSDPTHTQSKIKLELGKISLSVLSKDDTVDVSRMKAFTEIEVDVSGSLGASHKVKFKIAPEGGELPTEILPTDITLDQKELNLFANYAGVTLKPTVLPENAWVKDVEWSSSDSSIISVDASGFIMPLSAGTAVVTVKSIANPELKATASITVEEMEGLYIVSEDAFVRNGSHANTNYGADPSLSVKSDVAGYARKSYLKFNVDNIDKNDVESVVLRLFVSGFNRDPKRTLSVYATNNNWSEPAITWNNAPDEATLLSSKEIMQAGQWYEFDVTHYIKSIDLKEEISFLLQNTGPNTQFNDLSIASKEKGINQPQLIITSKDTPTDISTKDMKELVEKFEEEAAFVNVSAPRSLKIHLTAVGQFENQKVAKKVVKHMESFKLLLDQQKKANLISEEAYNSLQTGADSLIKKWE